MKALQIICLVLIFTTLIVAIPVKEQQSMRPEKSLSTDVMVLRTTSFGSAFYELKLLEKRFSKDDLFGALHTLVQDQYDSKDLENRITEQINQYTADIGNLYNQEINSINEDIQYFQRKGKAEEAEYNSLVQQLKSQQRVTSERQEDIRIFEKQLQEDNEKFKNFLDSFAKLKENLEVLTQQLGKDMNKIDFKLVDSYREELSKNAQEIENQNLKQIFTRKINRLPILNDRNKSDQQKLQDLQNDYLDLLETIVKQKQTQMEQVNKSVLQFDTFQQEAEIDIAKSQSDISELNYLIDKQEQNVSLIKKIIEQKEDYLQMTYNGKNIYANFKQKDLILQKNSITEINDSLDIIRGSMKIMQEPIENLYESYDDDGLNAQYF